MDNRLRIWLGALIIVTLAFCVLFRTPFSASNLDIPPDEVEYAIGAKNLLSGNGYQIAIQGQWLPPRYPPFFSVLFIAPWMAIFGTDTGIAILPVLASALLTVALAYWIGYRNSSLFGGVCAAITILLLPSFRFWSAHIMTDIPFVMIGMIVFAFFIFEYTKPSHHLGRWMGAGLAIALGLALRPVALAFCTPFIGLLVFRMWRRDITKPTVLAHLAALLLPLSLPVVFSKFYNFYTFGDIHRSGYLYWCAVPLDYPHLSFSLANIPMNLLALARSGLPWILIGIMLIWMAPYFSKGQKKAPSPSTLGTQFIPFAIFCGLGVLPISLFHLIYFFPSDRFHLLLLVILAITFGIMLARLVETHLRPIPKYSLVIAAFLTLFSPGLRTDSPPPYNRLNANVIDSICPKDAVIITTQNPVYLEDLLNSHGQRLIMPLSRSIEYANKCLTPKRISSPTPPPRHWSEGRAPGLLAAGATDAVPLVATEQIAFLLNSINTNRPVFIETLHLNDILLKDADLLSEHFTFHQVAKVVFELHPRNSDPTALEK